MVDKFTIKKQINKSLVCITENIQVSWSYIKLASGTIKPEIFTKAKKETAPPPLLYISKNHNCKLLMIILNYTVI